MRTAHRRAPVAAALGCALAVLTGADGLAQAPPCAVEVIVEPARPIVGEQVLYRARILRREDVDRVEWVQPPAFPNLRAEWLPGRAEDTEVTRDGTRYKVHEDQRALFAAWPGRTQLPHFELQCADTTILVPGPTLDVHSAPDRGRPADFTGVVGPLVVQATADRDEIALGQSVRVSILVRGDSNLWDLEPPFGNLDDTRGDKSFEIFRQKPELNLEAGERLYVRRYFRFDFVPRREGRLTIPGVRIPYYDTVARRYATARTEPIEISVSARRAASAPQRTESTSDGVPDAAEDGSWTGGAFAALLLPAGGFAGWRLIRRRRVRRAAIDDALCNASECRERHDYAGEAAALAKGLLRAAALATSRRRDSLEDETTAQLQRLEEIRFAAHPTAPQRETIDSLIRRLR